MADPGRTCVSDKVDVVVLRRDLGLGGAERLIVDSCCLFQRAGHNVTLYTARHDSEHCFPETADGTLNVVVLGKWIPTTIAGRMRAIMSILKTMWLALRVRSLALPHAVIFMDSSYGVGFVKLWTRSKVILYCHYPDQLMTPPRTRLYQIYRVPIDWWERRSARQADMICVNSRFTAAAARETFRLNPQTNLRVVNPGINCDSYEHIADITSGDPICLLSLNRFDPSKKLETALEAMHELRNLLPATLFARVRLILAGGFDERLPWCGELLSHLQTLTNHYELTEQVEFSLSPTEEERLELLRRCRCVVYTPPAEHFGLVAVEAMSAGRPVVAVDNAGPSETIVHEQTGLLVSPVPIEFAQALARVVKDIDFARQLGANGRHHVRQRFSFEQLQAALESVVHDVSRDHSPAA